MMPLDRDQSSVRPGLPDRLIRFHALALPYFDLPEMCQKVVSVFFDRDCGADQLLAQLGTNPAAAARLALEWERKTGKQDPDGHSLDYWVPRLGMDVCRRIWIRSQFEALWGVECKLTYAEAANEWMQRWVEQKPGRDPAYGDSAHLAGMLFDVLLAASQARPDSTASLRVLFEARFKRFLQSLDHALERAERSQGRVPKRILAAAISCRSVAELWFFAEDSAYAARYLKWEVQGIPIEMRRMLQRKYLGFNPSVAAAWVADQFPQLFPYREVIRSADTPSVFAKSRPEVLELAKVLGSAAEVG